MKIVFLSLMFEREKEAYYRNKIIGRMASPSNTFQYAILDGLYENGMLDDVIVVNSLPFGVYKKQYDELFIKRSPFVYGEKVIGETIPCINVHGLKQATRYIYAKRALSRIAQEFRDEKIVIITYNVYLPYVKASVNVASKFDNIEFCPIITDMPGEFGILPEKGIKRFILLRQSKKIFSLLKRAEKFILLTESMKRLLEIEDNYFVMEGIYSDIDDNNLSERLLHKETKVIAYTGSLYYEHGIYTLIDAYLELAKRHSDVELWICGGSGDTARINKLCSENKGIKFFGDVSRSESIAIQRTADVLVNPRPVKGEFVKYSFPSKTMEYLASGKPVVMYKLPGIPDEYDEFLNYVDYDSSESMCSVIENVLYYDNVAKNEKAKRGRSFILEEKSSKAQVAKMIAFLSKTDA